MMEQQDIHEKIKAGALVISIDLELHWGVRDIYTTDSPYTLRIIREREVTPAILDLFEKYHIRATWATVGMMFAKNREELIRFSPAVKPDYKLSRLNPYLQLVGQGEGDDPLHYGQELLTEIAKRRGQEIATHTFSHYYCLEQGQTRGSFAADLDSALKIAENYNIELHSIVFPRNQHNCQYDHILLDHGIQCYRGNEQHYIYQAEKPGFKQPHKRLLRLMDSFVNLTGFHLNQWEEMITPSGLCNIASSHYLRPIARYSAFLARLAVRRVTKAMEEAAQTNKVFHLWFHPQDFGLWPQGNLEILEAILIAYQRLKQRYGMLSLNMADTCAKAQDLYGSG